MSANQEALLRILYLCGGYYKCPKDADGNRLGPLVGYAGRDGQGHQFVGDVYYNFARIEESPKQLAVFASQVARKLRNSSITCDYVVGVPIGGLAFAQALALEMNALYVFPDFTEEKTDSGRTEKHFFWGRHELASSSEVIICEDVCNNFSSFEKIAELVEQNSFITTIACEMNRSELIIHSRPIGSTDKTLDIFSALHLPTVQYHQDDPEVTQDIERGNIIWKPKDQWNELMLAMQQHQVSD